MKKCSKCGIEKSLSEFHNMKDSPDGKRPRCKECRVEDTRAWNNANIEHRLAYNRKWEIQNITKKREHRIRQEAKRRAAKRGNGTFLVTIQDIQRLMAQPCFACGSRENLTVDHIVPIARGGKHAVGNLMTLCGSCNSSKGSMLWTEWRFSNTPRALDVFADRQEAGK